MDESAKITLGTVEYTVFPCTVGELRKITKAFQGEASEVPYEVLGIALKRAEPNVPDPEALVATLDQVREAVNTYLALGGLAKAPEGPPAGGA